MKKSFLSILFAFTFFSVFAVPGVKQFIPDASGEYVYYKDSTFKRESYIGILVYDDANYKIRYFAPTDEASKLPEKEMSILVSVNKDSAFWDMTGEYIMTQVLPGTEDADLIKKISSLNAQVLGNSNIDPFYGATCLLIVFADSSIHTYIEDGSLVIGNLMNAAYSINVDSCWIHRAREVFESEEGQKLKKEWGIAENFVGIGNCVLGYRAANLAEPKPRKADYIRYIK